MTADIEIWRLPKVLAETKLCRSTIYGLIAKGEFPRQVKLTPRASGWIASEVREYLAGRAARRDQSAAEATS